MSSPFVWGVGAPVVEGHTTTAGIAGKSTSQTGEMCCGAGDLWLGCPTPRSGPTCVATELWTTTSPPAEVGRSPWRRKLRTRTRPGGCPGAEVASPRSDSEPEDGPPDPQVTSEEATDLPSATERRRRRAGQGVSLFAGSELVARVERAECMLLAAAAAAARQRSPDDDVLELPIAGGLATWVGASSPVNKLAGLGFGGEVDQAERCQATPSLTS